MNQKINASVILIAAMPEQSAAAANNPSGYLIGGIIAILILGYLVYTLIRPEKF
jgi:K+-transporting ATPase KdpF subunit